MFRFLAILCLGGAILRAVFDWRATISQGEPWHFIGMGELLEQRYPEAFLTLQGVMSTTLSHEALSFYAHNIHGIPLVAILLFFGGIFWLVGGFRRRPTQRMVFSRS